jgi:hypothetical protein
VSKKARKKDSKEWVKKEGRKESKERKRQGMGEKERNQKHQNRKEAKESDEERKDKRKSLCFLQAFLPSFLPFSSLPFVALLSGKSFCKHKRGKKEQNNHNNNNNNDSRTRPPVSLANWWKNKKKKKQTNNSGNKQTLCTRRHAERQIPTPQTKRKKRGKAEGASAPFCVPNTIITRHFGGPLRAWVVAGSIITRNTDSIITRSWDSIITPPKGFRKIILA